MLGYFLNRRGTKQPVSFLFETVSTPQLISNWPLKSKFSSKFASQSVSGNQPQSILIYILASPIVEIRS
ncbi:hypothetical protein FGO68_gene3618 [Halteria grandinella]|uniref:Uncharacterized protein n=1 Tax=Halteria grandinella TaxID=5974 RepID=A0A8J8NXS7_HALGN|nr:hypothetical protein FGO68_gene3618 [Halteria grandinella]